MAWQRITETITGDGPGQSYELTYFRFSPKGNKTFPKVYLQGALHADEQPGIMVLHHLLTQLIKADKQGALQAEFVVFPMVNPVGMSQIQFNQHQGRYEHGSGNNFNRNWPNIWAAIKDHLPTDLGSDEAANMAQIDEALMHWQEELMANTAVQQWRKILIGEAMTADYVFDCHCDQDALLHIFAHPEQIAEVAEIANYCGAAATMTAADSGGGSFDEVWSQLWINLRNAYPDAAIAKRGTSVTMEYRGMGDVSDEQNQDDAQRLFDFLQSRGFIAGEAPAPQSQDTPIAPLNATQMLRVDRPGLLAYKVALGERVEKDQVVAELIPFDGHQSMVDRLPLRSGTAGIIVSKNVYKYVWPGCSIAKIFGTEALTERAGYLLEDK